MRIERRRLAVALGVAVALAATLAWWWPQPSQGILAANGQVRGTEVTVSAKAGGVAELVAVREGQKLGKGDLIAQIGSKEMEARLAQARALVEAAEAELGQTDVAIEQARLGAAVTRATLAHGVHQAGEALARAEAEVQAAQVLERQESVAMARFEKLSREGFVSASYMDEVRARNRTTRARLEAALRTRDEAHAALERARAATGEAVVREKDPARLRAERAALGAQLKAAQARAAEIEAALADMRLVAPSEGTVISRLAEPGELAAPATPIATLVDLEDLFVKVYVAERDIGKLRLGNAARISVDAFPGRFFTGRVVEVAQQAEFTPKEVHMQDERAKLVFGVKVRIENPEGYLKPGMPADVRIKWREDAAW